jgi:ribosome biogenesis GTPase
MSSVRGTVRETGGGVYVVALDGGRSVEASIRGRLRQEARTGGRIVVGDHVRVSRSGSAWTIDEVEARRTVLARRGRSGRTAKVLAANLDRVFVVVALREPPATPHLIDRLLVLVESSGMHPSLVLNKADLPGAPDVARTLAPLYESVGYQVFVASVETGQGMPALTDAFCSGASALIGPSGVGKSSLLNAIDPGLELRTGVLSRKTGTGRHTTVGSRLIELSCGGLVADTPGFGDVGLWSVSPDAVADCFPDFASLRDECRFRGCAHVREPECAVRRAVEEGRVPASRYESYLALRAEAMDAEAC